MLLRLRVGPTTLKTIVMVEVFSRFHHNCLGGTLRDVRELTGFIVVAAGLSLSGLVSILAPSSPVPLSELVHEVTSSCGLRYVGQVPF